MVGNSELIAEDPSEEGGDVKATAGALPDDGLHHPSICGSVAPELGSIACTGRSEERIANFRYILPKSGKALEKERVSGASGYGSWAPCSGLGR